MNTLTVSLWATIFLSCTPLIATAQSTPQSSNAELEAIKRSKILQESLEGQSEITRKSLQENAIDKGISAKLEDMALPSWWTDASVCKNIQKLGIRKVWGRELVSKQVAQLIELDRTCLHREQYITHIRAAAQALTDQGFLVTSAVPVQTLEEDTSYFDIHLLSLDEIVFDNEADVRFLRGLDIKKGMPINLRVLDELIERMSRLRHNDPHINISPSADYKTTSIRILNSKSSQDLFFDGGITQRRGARIHSANAVFEDLLGQNEVVALSLQHSILGTGHANVKSISVETPVANSLLNLTYSESNSRNSFVSNDTTYMWLSNDRQAKIELIKTVFRDHNTLLTFNGNIKIKNTKTKIDEYLTESQSPKLTVGEMGLSLKHLIGHQSLFVSELNLNFGLPVLDAQRDDHTEGLTRSDAHAQFFSWRSTNILSQPLTLWGKNYRWINVLQLFSANHGLYPSEQILMSSQTGVEGLFKSQTLADKAWTAKTSLSSEFSVPGLERPLLGTMTYAYAQGSRYVDSNRTHLSGASLQISYPIPAGRLTVTNYLPSRNRNTLADSASVSLSVQFSF